MVFRHCYHYLHGKIVKRNKKLAPKQQNNSKIDEEPKSPKQKKYEEMKKSDLIDAPESYFQSEEYKRQHPEESLEQEPLTKRQEIQLTENDYKLLMTRLCRELNTLLTDYRNIDSMLSGACATFVLIDQDLLVVANVGDSKAVVVKSVGKERKAGIRRGLSTVAKNVTRFLTADVAEERDRILMAGGEIRPSVISKEIN